jgi:hypothetical protein
MTTLPIADNGALLLRAGSKQQMASKKVAYQTPRTILLAIYAIIPVCALAVFIDQAFLDGWLKAHLPHTPEAFLLFVIFFVQPHIIASAGTFFDRDYLRHYWKRLLPAALILAGIGMFFPSLIITQGFIIFSALWGITHFTGQQCGIIHMMGRGFKRSYAFWRWMSLLMAAPIYYGMFSFMPLSHEMQRNILTGLCVGLVPYLYVSYLVYRTADTQPARYYMLANVVGAIAEIALYSMGYYFFVIVISRVIHDLSAFTFYISHDANRNAGGVKNIFYRSLRFLPVPVYVLCPLIAVALAFPLTYYMHYDWAYRIGIPLTLFHYYTDRFVWKKGSLHREYIRMR